MFELAVALILICINGLFALSELAIVSARKGRLRSLVESGRSGAAQALALAENPGRFLSTVQIGITLVGILAGAFSGAALSARLDTIFEDVWNVPTRISEPLAYALVIGAITYFSVIIGELVPKQLALRNPEAVACIAAPPMTILSRAAAPVIWLLDVSTRIVLWVFGIREGSAASVTEQDIKTLIMEAENAGVIESDERTMITGVLRLGDRAVRALMTPRIDVEWIDINDSPEMIRQELIATSHSRLPAALGDADNVIGVLQSRDLLAAALKNEPLDVATFVRKAPIVPDTVDALRALATLRDAEVPMALVHDEYGHFQGIVTPADILDAIAGSFRSDADAEPDAVQRTDGSWLLSGAIPVDEMAEQFGLILPGDRDYETLAGFLINELRRLPEVADMLETQGWRFEIVDLDGRRIDKVLVSRAES